MALGLLCAVAAMGTPAFADGVSGYSPTQVEYLSDPTSPRLLIGYNGVFYYAWQNTSPGCSIPALSSDAIRNIQALVTAALLANKNMVIYYNTCNSTRYVYDVALQK